MSRIHRITHPKFGPVSWSELREIVNGVKRRENRKACWWCVGPIPKNSRTRCHSAECARKIMDLVYWGDVACRCLSKSRYVCALCRFDTEFGAARDIQVDHIVPVSLGGTGDDENLRALCSHCHKDETARLRRDGPAFKARMAGETVKIVTDAHTSPGFPVSDAPDLHSIG